MQNTDVKIATNIETGIFYSIIEFLKTKNWNLRAEYDESIFDKGIDFDYYEFSRDDEKIRLAWNNWFEGEIEATDETLKEIARQFMIDLKFNEPEYLHRHDIIENMKGLIKLKN